MSLSLRRPSQAVASILKAGRRGAYKRFFKQDVGPIKPWRAWSPNRTPPPNHPTHNTTLLDELVAWQMRRAEEDGMEAQREEQRLLREAGLIEPDDKGGDKSPKGKTK